MKNTLKDAHWSVEQLWFFNREIWNFVYIYMLHWQSPKHHLPSHLYDHNSRPLFTFFPYAGYSGRARRDENFPVIFIFQFQVTFEIFNFEIFHILSSKSDENQNMGRRWKIKKSNFYDFDLINK